jgi:hypothetical protein
MEGLNMGTILNFPVQLARNPKFQASLTLISAVDHLCDLSLGVTTREAMLDAYYAVEAAAREELEILETAQEYN